MQTYDALGFRGVRFQKIEMADIESLREFVERHDHRVAAALLKAALRSALESSPFPVGCGRNSLRRAYAYPRISRGAFGEQILSTIICIYRGADCSGADGACCRLSRKPSAALTESRELTTGLAAPMPALRQLQERAREMMLYQHGTSELLSAKDLPHQLKPQSR